MFAANTYDMLAAVSVGDRSGCTTQRDACPSVSRAPRGRPPTVALSNGEFAAGCSRRASPVARTFDNTKRAGAGARSPRRA